ncbi:MAG: hypothetical protein K6U04_07330 [Armatimonadetes bacterium]|nr:hypothetical protein [Armatimonadota bacterium]
MTKPKQKPALDVKVGPGKYRRYEFDSEEDKAEWEKLYRKSKLFMPYFLVGVGINFLLYFAGLDLSKNIMLGALVGLGIPLASMYLFSELHFRLVNRQTPKR